LKVSVFIATSIDGFIARENGDIDWLSGSEGEGSDEDYGYQEYMDSVDVLVMGRNTYEKVLTFGQWPGDWPYGNKPIVVLSSRPLHIPDDLSETVESSSSPPAELVEQLSGRGANHLYIEGGKQARVNPASQLHAPALLH
jgi:dihydrofolate reductase